MVLAAVVRLDDIRQPLVDAFSWREASTAMMADNFPHNHWNIFYPEVSWTGPGPSYQGRELPLASYMAALLSQMFGWHDWFGRAVSAAFGLSSVFFLYKVVQRTIGQGAAYGAAVTLALLPGAVAIQRAVLPDAAMFALVLAGLWAYLAWLERGGWWRLALAVAATGLGILAKPPGLTVLLPMAYASWIYLRDPAEVSRRWAALLALAVVAVVTGAYFSWAVYLGTHYPPYHVAGSGYVWQELPQMIAHKFYLRRLIHVLTVWFATPVFLLLAIVGATSPVSSPMRLPHLFHVWLIGGGIFFLAAAREITNNPWNLLYLAAPIAAFAGLALSRLLGSPGGRHRALVLIQAVLVVGLMSWASRTALASVKHPYAADGLALGRTLADLAAPNDTVIAVSNDVGDPIAVYYSRRRGWVFPPGGGAVGWDRLKNEPQALADLDRLRAAGADWFGVAKRAQDSDGALFLDSQPLLVGRLDAVGRRVVDDETMVIWRLSPP